MGSSEGLQDKYTRLAAPRLFEDGPIGQALFYSE